MAFSRWEAPEIEVGKTGFFQPAVVGGKNEG